MNAEEYRGVVNLNAQGDLIVEFCMGESMFSPHPIVRLVGEGLPLVLLRREVIALYDALTSRMEYLREAAKA